MPTMVGWAQQQVQHEMPPSCSKPIFTLHMPCLPINSCSSTSIHITHSTNSANNSMTMLFIFNMLTSPSSQLASTSPHPTTTHQNKTILQKPLAAFLNT